MRKTFVSKWRLRNKYVRNKIYRDKNSKTMQFTLFLNKKVHGLEKVLLLALIKDTKQRKCHENNN